jgi:hypothetical protein
MINNNTTHDSYCSETQYSHETHYATTPKHNVDQFSLHASSSNTHAPNVSTQIDQISNTSTHTHLHNDLQIDNSQMEIDDQPTSNQQTDSPDSLSTSWANETNQFLEETSSVTPLTPNDIRNKTPPCEQEKILEFCDELNQCERTAKNIVNFFLKIKNDTSSSPRTSLKGIFSKINHRDRDFFRTFAKEELIKGQHQLEYEKIEKEFHINYLKTNNIGYITRSTKRKIKTIINKALFVAFLRSTDLSILKFWQVAQLLDYGFNFFLDPTLSKINYQEIYESCEDLIKQKLPDLPHNPEDIPIRIKIKLPKAIPILHSKDTGEIAGSLRAFYNFDLLPNSYFVKKPDLPNNPLHLNSQFQSIFPLTKRNELANLKSQVDKLREFYYVPNKLPESYFDLPPPKSPLPPSFKDLPSHLVNHFPTNNDPESIKNHVQLLRDNNFAVLRLPLDYIRVKRPLPPPHWYSENNSILLPVTTQEESETLIKDLKAKFFFKLPLSPEWIKENLIQSIKPKLPTDFSTLETELNITKEQLNRDSPDFNYTIKKIKNKYLGNIPREWITPLLPDLPDLNEANSILLENQSPLTLPLLDNPHLNDNIKTLSKYFHFEKLPPNFIIEPESPEPALALLPKIL